MSMRSRYARRALPNGIRALLAAPPVTAASLQTVAPQSITDIWKCVFVLITSRRAGGRPAPAPKKEVVYVSPRARASFAPAPLQHARAQASPAPTRASPTPIPLQHACARTNPNHERSTERQGIADVADDVIDLGAPRATRRLSTRAAPRRESYVPNPRLYPGRPRPRTTPPLTSAAGRTQRHKRALRRPVPNLRLYRPAPPRPPPPSAHPRAPWPPPPPPRPLDTASHVALRLGAARAGCPAPPPVATAPAPLSRRLVVKLPAVESGDSPPAPYQPASEHYHARVSLTCARSVGASTPRHVMDAAGRQSASPEGGSDGDGNDTLSAPSEILAEFLSAIMRRQYAEALKYCRLILQYEPHNATARGFYPLLQHKVLHHQDPTGGDRAGSSEETSTRSGGAYGEQLRADSLMEQAADSEGSEDDEQGSGGSVASQSSLELDSEPSLELSRRTDSGSGCWESSGSASRSDADDNGNASATASQPRTARALTTGDENDNAACAGAGEPNTTRHFKSEPMASLRRLRAQFTCSIK